MTRSLLIISCLFCLCEILRSATAAPALAPAHRTMWNPTLLLPSLPRRLVAEPEAEAEQVVDPIVSVREDVEKRGLPKSRPGSGSNYNTGQPYGRRNE
ncbi:hypothetical protein BGX29_009723 [Mortierella sp. GBA35]|nr:hypothetical protein BGX23_009870 [Mortierella sp. AD031]KAF9093960.1 hypothetical protein BGX29_009723 [Mortierella sp. GBA35]KAG0198914.1 hypothetical protein BGX33_011996 [Mortierella sp. NVP41]